MFCIPACRQAGFFLLSDKSVETAPWSEAPPDYHEVLEKLQNPHGFVFFAYFLPNKQESRKKINKKYQSLTNFIYFYF